MNIAISKTIADKLICSRIRLGMTQQFVADMTGISKRTISRIECGKGSTDTTIRELCALYKIRYSSLFEEDEIVKPANVEILSGDDVLRILYNSTFVDAIQRQVVLEFSRIIGKNAVMDRKQVEYMLTELLSDKKQYTKAELIQCCIEASQCTVRNINAIAIAS